MTNPINQEEPQEKSKREIFIETVLRLDDENNIDELISYGFDLSHDPHDIYVFSISQLLMHRRIRAAYILSMVFKNKGYSGMFIAIGLCVGGLIYNNPIEYERGLKDLSDITDLNETDRVAAWQQTNLYRFGIIPVMIHLLDLVDLDKQLILQFSAAMRATIPFVWTFFASDAVVPILSLEDLAQRDPLKERLFKTNRFLKTFLELEEKRDQDDFTELVNFMQNDVHAPYDILLVILILLITTKTNAAFLCAMLLANQGYRHPLISFVLAVGGLHYSNSTEEARGLRFFIQTIYIYKQVTHHDPAFAGTQTIHQSGCFSV